MPPELRADLYVDSKRLGTVENGSEYPIPAGLRHLKIVRGSARCEQDIRLFGRKVTTMKCTLARAKPGLRLDNKTSVTWSFKSTPFHEAMGVVAKSCGLNLIVPDDISAKVNAQITAAPCNEALESVLEAQGLWYAYDKDSNLVRIGPRRQLDTEREDAAARLPSTHKRLPPSEKKLDMDFKDVPLRDLLPMLTISVGKMNLVIPDDINAKTTVFLKNVPWDRAFESVLEAHGLWYRYREEGKIIRIAPRRQLDAEDDDAR
jgi:type II secretory pathway component HofQ